MKFKEVYWGSDHHFFHDNIIKYCNRPFKDADEMTSKFISSWNKKVPKNAEVYYLGDFTMGGSSSFEEIKSIISQLNGKITFIKGNHDNDELWRKIEKAKLPNVVAVLDVCIRTFIRPDGNKQKIHMNHYPLRSWDGSYHGSWHLYGHEHGQMEMHGKSMDIGVDTREDYSLWSLSEICQILDNQPNVHKGQSR